MKHLQTTHFDFSPGHNASRRRPGYPLTLRKPHGVRRLGHLSDFHFGKTPADGVASTTAVEHWLEGFGEAGVDVLLVTGDLVEVPGDRRRLLEAKKLLDRAPFPSLVIPGNHDIPEPGAIGPFEEIFGRFPRVDVHEEIEFVLFDSMKGLPGSERSLFDRIEARTGSAYSRGKVGDAQMDEAEPSLGEAPRFGRAMLVHHHLLSNAPTRQGFKHHPTQPHGLMGPLDDAAELVAWASTHQVRLIFHGHKHAFWEPYEPVPGVLVLNSGSSTLGKPRRPRRARIVDVGPEMASVAVHDLRANLP